MREGLVDRLKKFEFVESVVHTADASSALETLRGGGIDIVIMDVALKKVSGIELSKNIMLTAPEVSIIILTMVSEENYVVLASEMGAKGYVLKDAPSSEFDKAIDVIRRGGTYFWLSVPYRQKKNLPTLSQREIEILAYIAEGFSNREVAQALCVSTRTIDAHRRNIKRKIGSKNQVDLLKFAIENYRADPDFFAGTNPGKRGT